uniref:UDP-D-apiose/UDP-D-xylose synthase 2-like isoform X2 n=1 Tax=Elaeis guineensis var. tenera TaxID=51953 RepID=A0A8N4ERS2_ELAGV|nr:UDP-D-apiose/UDP-D-xylose synthase 2-like isoform X2 [Elaeis guineensis]
MARVDLDGNPIEPMKICIIGAGGFIGSHLCDKLMAETPHTVLAVDVYSDKIKHLLEPPPGQGGAHPWAGRIQFHRLNIKHDSRLEGLIKMSELTINLAAICTPADYNTRPLDTIYSNFVDAFPVVKYCSENSKRLIHFSTCEVYGKTIGSFLPKDHPLRQNLLRREPLKLVDGGQSQRTFVYIKDAIEAVLLMIENPARANGQIFNVGNPNNEVTVKQLAEMMTEVYSKVSGEPLLKVHTIDVSSKEFYGEGYDDSDKRILDMTIINKQLGWSPKTLLWDLLESTLTYQHRTYAQAIRRTMVKPIASS